MNKEQTLALYAREQAEPGAWNAWAQEMLARRAELEVTGKWAVRDNFSGSRTPSNEATAHWFNDANAKFSDHPFGESAKFKQFIFPSIAIFNNCLFRSEALFEGAHFFGNVFFVNANFCRNAKFVRAKCNGMVQFSGATFNGWATFDHAELSEKAEFDHTMFHGYARFVNASFIGHAEFESAVFRENAQFDQCRFSNDARFGGAKFNGNVTFYRSMFSGHAEFNRTTFIQYAEFHKANFNKNALFSQAHFKGNMRFDDATFKQETNFYAAHGEGGFSLDRARFAHVPNFKQAHFSEAPTLDDVVIPEVPCAGESVWRRLIRKRHTTSTAAEYRALKRLAIQAHDHKLELDFFASELKASGGATRWTVGLLYELFSNFGRCWLLPLIWLAVTWVVSAWGYVAMHFAAAEAAGRSYGIHSLRWAVRWITSGLTGAAPGLSCINASSTDPLSAAALLSLAKSLPYGAVLPDAKSVDVFKCLFGCSIPGGVVVVGIVQLLLSLVLLFLFLLAVRNHFRIR